MVGETPCDGICDRFNKLRVEWQTSADGQAHRRRKEGNRHGGKGRPQEDTGERCPHLGSAFSGENEGVRSAPAVHLQRDPLAQTWKQLLRYLRFLRAT